MQQPYLLPSGFSSMTRRTNLAPVFIAVFLAVFAGAGYLIWLGLSARHKAPPPAAPVTKAQTSPAPATDPLMEDLVVHFQNAIQSTIRSSELARQSQRQIRAVMPAMERNYLYVEQSRLEAADSLANRAIRECNRASEELEVAQKLAQEKINEGGK